MAGESREVKTEILVKEKAREKVTDLSKQYGVSESKVSTTGSNRRSRVW